MCHSALETICDRLLSSSALKFNLRRYNLACAASIVVSGEYEAGRCRLTVSKPVLKLVRAHGHSA